MKRRGNGAQEHPEKEQEALDAIVQQYAAGNPGARTGRAMALKACASCWSGPRVQAALDFLLSRGLADADDGVRNHMVEAGVPFPLKDQHAQLRRMSSLVHA